MQTFPYISRGQKICQSSHHKDMFIINSPDGGFHTVSTSLEVILSAHRPDEKQVFIEVERFNFPHTSNYKQQKAKENNYWQDVRDGKIKPRILKPRERYDN